MAQNGSWDVGIDYPIAGAMAAAIRECKAMTSGENDCGTAFATSRGGWIIVDLADLKRMGLLKPIVGGRIRAITWKNDDDGLDKLSVIPSPAGRPTGRRRR
jgi:hypothetical protein